MFSWAKGKVVLVLFSMVMLIACQGTGVEENEIARKSPSTGTKSVYPLRTEKTLTYWAELNRNAASVVSHFDKVPFFQEWQRRTGVKLNFLQPPPNQQKQALNMLLSSGNLPDLIEYAWSSFPGGPEKAIQEGYILRLNEAMELYAPNLMKYLKENPDIDKQVKTDNGSYYVFPFIRGDDLLKTFQGPIVRKDWLDQLGLEVPTTMDEWYTVLKAFKERKGVEAPLTVLGTPGVLFGLDTGAFIGAYGVIKGFYLDNGKVKYGPAEQGYKEFLSTFRKWYEEGLIDRNFATVDTATMDSLMGSGKSGATVWNAGAGIGKWQGILEKKDKQALIAPAPYPVLKKGDKPKFGQSSGSYVGSGSVAISGTTKHIEEAVKLLDYGYSPEGHMFFNFGMEGISYNMVDGYPEYTDLIMNNPDKWDSSQALAMYTRASYFGPFVQDKRYMEQYYTLPQQREALALWTNTDNGKHSLPLMQRTEQEHAEYSSIMLEITQLVNEMTLKMIMGLESTEQFDTYVSKMKELKLDRAVEIEQSAYYRYQGR